MARNINDFPEELVQLVLQAVRTESRCSGDASFTHCLTVCQRWHRIGEQLLWTDIALTNLQLKKFCASKCTAFEITRSLTVAIIPPKDGPGSVYNRECENLNWWEGTGMEELDRVNAEIKRDTNEIWQQLEHLPTKIRLMKQLESFSVYVLSYDCVIQTPCFYLRNREMGALVDALPATVRNLELDDHCYQRPNDWEEANDHICPSLCRIIPQLHNLRLRLQTICEAMLPGPEAGGGDLVTNKSPNGIKHTFVLQTIPLSQNVYTRHCTWPNEQVSGFSAVENILKNESVCDFLVPRVKSAIAAHSLENFDQISLISWKIPPDPQPRPQRQYKTMCERIIGTEDKVRRSPLYYVSSGGRYIEGLRYATDDGQTLDVIGETDRIVQYAEGQTWVETRDGYHLPEAYLKANTRFRHAEIKPLALHTREGLNAPLNETAELWKMEDVEGCQLLSGEVSSSFDEVDCLGRKPTQKELRREERRKAIERGEEVDEDASDDSYGSDEDENDFCGYEVADFSDGDDDGSDNEEAEPADYL
ncbi:hypothetical protein H2200_000512 [Cladophialophora chaetospira]|uniref:F-box domain-containing protein n=1 Tax=Cladophialophora chaetospira TaxID=386627 RepID=A0AA39CR08_9EURO|nr:hypothetical protein H2200_000512 [Cladophialophora chaetospira]